VSYELNDDLTRKDVIQEKRKEAEVEEAIRKLTESENYYQFFMRDEDTVEQLIEQIKYFAKICDTNYIFIEPIQDVVAGKSDSNKEELLADLAVRLSKLAAELGIAIVTIAHTNDDGEIKYCRMIGQRAGIIVRLERDKESTDEVVNNTTHLYIEKNRPLSMEGYAGSLFFDRDTFTLRESA
jgi:predicted ATP-dependent serine protease